jgi:hypothetical protein
LSAVWTVDRAAWNTLVVGEVEVVSFGFTVFFLPMLVTHEDHDGLSSVGWELSGFGAFTGESGGGGTVSPSSGVAPICEDASLLAERELVVKGAEPASEPDCELGKVPLDMVRTVMKKLAFLWIAEGAAAPARSLDLRNGVSGAYSSDWVTMVGAGGVSAEEEGGPEERGVFLSLSRLTNSRFMVYCSE